jgi:hypothetical protein
VTLIGFSSKILQNTQSDAGLHVFFLESHLLASAIKQNQETRKQNQKVTASFSWGKAQFFQEFFSFFFHALIIIESNRIESSGKFGCRKTEKFQTFLSATCLRVQRT